MEESISIKAKCQPTSQRLKVESNTEQIMRGLETKVRVTETVEKSQRLRYAQMNRMHTSNFLFNVFHIKVILMHKLRLAPNQALHVTIYIYIIYIIYIWYVGNSRGAAS